MLTSAVLTILSLFSVHVLADVTWPDCTVSSLNWTYNSLGQNPCEVAAFLQSICYGGEFHIPALPQGRAYNGPAYGDNTLCKCSTIVYSLLSACDACQGDPWFNWKDFSGNCTAGQPASSFPVPVPAGIRVPQWALIDITVEGTWDSTQSYAVGDLPEVLPGALINGTSTSTSSVIPSSTATTSTSSSISSSEPTDTATSSSPSPSSSAGSSSNVGAIRGGVAGGLVAVSAAALILFFF
ncbi:hypothetical protein BGW80DRAFT_375632 [Lactifluus volemus]|nr:hypothetical protein BGW80DRAFT_375632 [Lactifluus volemus]